MVGITIGGSCVAGVAFGVPAVAAVVFVCAALALDRRVTIVWSGAVIVAAILGALRAQPAPGISSPDWVDTARALRGVVDSGPLTTGRGQSFDLAVTEVRSGGAWEQKSDIVCVSAAALPEVRFGDRVFLVVTGERLTDLPNRGGRAMATRGCSAAVTAWQMTLVDEGRGWRHAVDGARRAIADRLQAPVPGDAGALLAGLVTGDDGALSGSARDAFIGTSTTHITAVSGGNLALIVVSAAAFGGAAGISRRLFWQALTAIGVWGYAVLVGLEAPAVRAAMVATGAVFAARFGRRADLVTLTALAAALQLLWRPADYWSLSFRLSFVSALALTLVLRGMSGQGITGAARSLFVGTAAAQLAATPVLISTFGTLSPLSLPANLAIAPLVAIAFPVAAVAGVVGLLSETLGGAIAVPGALCAETIVWLVRQFARVDDSQVTVGPLGVAGSALLIAVGIGTVASLSLDCRQAVRRGWRGANRLPRSGVVLFVVGGLGFVIGLSIGALR